MTLLLGLLFLGISITTKDSNWVIASSICFVAFELSSIAMRLKHISLTNKEKN